MNVNRLKELLDYDPVTGQFFWLIKPSIRVDIGDIAGRKTMGGYIEIIIKGKIHKAHRLAFLIMTGFMPSGQVDHINGIRHDNCFSNLRDVDADRNSKNKSIYKNNKSGASGVHWCKNRNRWYASIRVCGKVKYLGVYFSLSDAKSARIKAERNFGFHENHGDRRRKA